METLVEQYPYLWWIAAFLLGMLVMWLLEMFILRRRIKGELDELQGSLKRTEADLQEAQETSTQLRAELKSKGDELTNALTARSAVERSSAELKQQLAQTSTDLQNANQMRAQLEKNLQARNAELDTLRAQLDNFSTDNQKLQSQASALQTDLDKSKASNSHSLARIAELTTAAAVTAAVVKGLENSKSELTAQVADLTARTNELSTQVNELTDQTVVLKTNLENTRGELNAARMGKANAENELADLKVSQGQLRAELDQVSEERSGLAADVAKLTAGALAADELIRFLEGNKAELTSQVAHLRVDLDAQTKAHALSDAELADLKLQLSKLDTALGIARSDKSNYQAELAARVSEIEATKAEIVRLRDDNDSLLADIAKFTARAAAASALVKGLQDEKAQLNAQMEQLRVDRAAAAETASTATLAPQPAAGQADSAEIYEAPCPQDLTDVKGIGAEYEQRLYNAGIGTYWDLYNLSEEELARILEINELTGKSVNLAGIRGDALRLARETRTQGRTWKGAAPDDFDILQGIGRIFEKRLYEAGICSYEALARANVAELDAICRAPEHLKPDYQSWIDQARLLVEARKRKS